MGWFSTDKAPKPLTGGDRYKVPDDVWAKCPNCNSILYTKELRKNLSVCPKCEYHFRLNAKERIELIADRFTFVEFNENLHSSDPLGFKDNWRGVSYKDKLKKSEKKCDYPSAVRTGKAKINGISVMLGVLDFNFMGGSLDSVVGEKLTFMVEEAIKENKPVIIVSASGGARMQEGMISLMQMAKVSSAIAKLGQHNIPYISVLTDPTTGGVAASFAMLGDINIAEPKALIGFAGPRVVEKTINKKLPEGFQKSEFLLEHGMIDMIVNRCDLKNEITKILTHLTGI